MTKDQDDTIDLSAEDYPEQLSEGDWWISDECKFILQSFYANIANIEKMVQTQSSFIWIIVRYRQ